MAENTFDEFFMFMYCIEEGLHIQFTLLSRDIMLNLYESTWNLFAIKAVRVQDRSVVKEEF